MADGVRHEVARSDRVSTPVLLLLLVVGPIGWLALLFLALASPDRSEQLAVQVPWTTDTQAGVDALRRRRRYAWALAAIAAVASFAMVATAAGPVAGPGMTARVVQSIVLLVGVAAVAVALAAEWRLGRRAVRVDLDASRRWVTLGNVHPAFARAVRADQRRRAPQP
ncbi:MAG TPA: hypothetical protein VFZ79_03705 [Acidimicrobiales bacterium]